MQFYARIAALTLAFCTQAPGVNAQPRPPLEGWGPFRFSMSFAEAMSAARGRAIEGPNGTIRYETIINGMNFGSVLSFEGRGDRIRNITVSLQGVRNLNERQCREKFAEVVSMVAGRYGRPDVPEMERNWLDSSHRNFSSEYKFPNGATLSPTITIRVSPSAIFDFDCAIGIVYSAGQNRGRDTF